MIIQSAFRYDFEKQQVIKAIKSIKKNLHDKKVAPLSRQEMNKLISLLPSITTPYRSVIEKIAPLVNIISSFVARRRERMLHIGLFGYSRGVGKVTLPRAITFTAALYSLGIPPELIGTGRGLRKAQKAGLLEVVLKN